MGLLKKGVSQEALIVRKGGMEFELKKLTLDNGILKEALTDRDYVITEDPIKLKLSSHKSIDCYLLDGDKGTTIKLQRDGMLYSLKTTPTLVSRVIDTRLLEEAFGLKPSTRSLIMAFIFGALLGLLF